MNDIADDAERLGSEDANVEGEDGGADEENGDGPGDLADKKGLLASPSVLEYIAPAVRKLTVYLDLEDNQMLYCRRIAILSDIAAKIPIYIRCHTVNQNL